MGAIDRGCLRISVGGDLVWPQDVPRRASRMALVRDLIQQRVLVMRSLYFPLCTWTVLVLAVWMTAQPLFH